MRSFSYDLCLRSQRVPTHALVTQDVYKTQTKRDLKSAPRIIMVFFSLSSLGSPAGLQRATNSSARANTWEQRTLQEGVRIIMYCFSIPNTNHLICKRPCIGPLRTMDGCENLIVAFLQNSSRIVTDSHNGDDRHSHKSVRGESLWNRNAPHEHAVRKSGGERNTS